MKTILNLWPQLFLQPATATKALLKLNLKPIQAFLLLVSSIFLGSVIVDIAYWDYISFETYHSSFTGLNKFLFGEPATVMLSETIFNLLTQCAVGVIFIFILKQILKFGGAKEVAYTNLFLWTAILTTFSKITEAILGLQIRVFDWLDISNFISPLVILGLLGLISFYLSVCSLAVILKWKKLKTAIVLIVLALIISIPFLVIAWLQAINDPYGF